MSFYWQSWLKNGILDVIGKSSKIGILSLCYTDINIMTIIWEEIRQEMAMEQEMEKLKQQILIVDDEEVNREILK